MLSFLIRLVISALALLGIAQLFGSSIEVASFGTAVIAAIVLGLVNAFIKPILEFVAAALTLPLSCVTLGLWNLVLGWIINGLMFYAVAAVLDGFTVRNFGAAMLGALALSVVNAVASGLVKDKPGDKGNRRRGRQEG